MSAAEIILIDDSDDEEETAKPVAQKSKSSSSFVNLLGEESDDVVYQRQIQQAMRDSLLETTQATAASRNKNVKKSHQSHRVSLSQTSSNNRYDDSDDSDSDDSLLNDEGLQGLLATKTPARKAVMHRETTTPAHSTPNYTSSAPPQSSSSSRSTPVVNPYSSRKSPGSASLASASQTPSSSGPIRNPYSSNKKKAPPQESASTSSTAVATAGIPMARGARDVETIVLEGSEASFPTGDSFPYPRLLKNSKQYPDLRPRYLLALWSYARSLTLHSHDHSKLDQTIAKVIRLSLSPFPLRSLEEFCALCGGTGSIADFKHRRAALEQQLDAGKMDSYNVPVGVSRDGLYCSIPEALLVAMATEVDRRRRSQGAGSLSQQLASKDMWISFEFLIPEIEKRLHPLCPGRMQRKKDADGGLAYYLDESTRSAEMLQVRKLQLTCKDHTLLLNLEQNNGHEGYIKKRKFKKQVVFELLPLGYRTAQWIQQRSFPASASYYRTSRIGCLDQVDPNYKGICLAVDFREGGLQKSVLQKMCKGLDMSKVPFFVGALDIGDYAFFCAATGKLCPVLIERKSIQDVAHSIGDGRWVNQKQRMYHGQYVFKYDNCRMAYIIEGNIEKELVSNNFVGHRKFNVTRERLEEAIDGLKAEGFDILRSSSPENSMLELGRWAIRVAEEIRTGKLEIQYTFEEFKEAVKKISREVDFSRLAKYHMKSQLERERQSVVAAVSETATEAVEDLDRKRAAKHSRPAVDAIDLCSDDDDDSIKERVSSKENHRRASHRNELQERKPPPKSNPMLKDSSASRANAIRSEHMLKASPAVQAYFCDGDGNKRDDSDSDGNETDDSDPLMARVGKSLAKEEKFQKRKRKRESKERAKQKAKKPKSAQKGKKPKTTHPLKETKITSKEATKSSVPGNEYEEWTSSQLKAKCEEYGLPKAGKKNELIARLNGPRPPKVWLERKKKDEYVPVRQNTGATALLVALYLHERDQGSGGMTKDLLYAKAEGLGISKNPFSGGTTQTGESACQLPEFGVECMTLYLLLPFRLMI